MAIITNYSTLQTAVADYLARDDLTTYIPNFIQAAENKIYRRYLHRGLEASTSGAISSAALAVPSDYMVLKFAYVDAAPATYLDWVPVETIWKEYPLRTNTDTPKVISRQGSNFVFGPAGGTQTIQIVYYKALDKLADGSATTNWYTVNAPEVLLYGSLIESGPFLQNDPRLAIWGSLFEQAISTVMDRESRERGSEGPVAMRAV